MPYTRLRYHIVFATKSRKPIITAEAESFLFPVLGKIGRDLGGRIIQVGGVPDHIHIIAAIPPKIAVSDYLRDLKRDSSAALRTNVESLVDFRWQRGFSCFTVSAFEIEELKAYVANQKHHHSSGQLIDAFEPLEKLP